MRGLSSKPTSLAVRPGAERAVGQAGEENGSRNKEPVGERDVYVAGTLLGGVGYPLCHLLRRHAPRAPAALLVFGEPGVLSKGGAGGTRIHAGDGDAPLCDRSEERRVGKECRSRWSP